MKKQGSEGFRFQFRVRGYELDSFGHVNNAVYFQYFEQARWELLAQWGWLGWCSDNGRFLVVTETNIRYSRELLNFDPCEITTLIEVSAPFLIFRHELTRLPDHDKIASARVKTLLVDHQRTPLDLPRELIDAIAGGTQS